MHLFVATRGEIFSLKFTKHRLAAWLRPDPLGELKRSPRPPSRNKGGPTSNGRGRQGRGRRRGNLLQAVRGDRRPWLSVRDWLVGQSVTVATRSVLKPTKPPDTSFTDLYPLLTRFSSRSCDYLMSICSWKWWQFQCQCLQNYQYST